MGYAGGTTPHPTYRRIGDHSEAVQVDFDPSVVRYEALLAVFTSAHNPCARGSSTQYRSAIFAHDDAQRAAAEAALARHAAGHGAVHTRVERFTGFTVAEDYHQKYTLRATPAVLHEIEARYADQAALRESPVAMRLNAWLAGDGDAATFEADLAACRLTRAAEALLRARVPRPSGNG